MIKVALVIGHKASSQGAANQDAGTTEFQFNEPLVKSIAAKLATKAIGTDLEGVIEPIVVYRDIYQNLPGEINELNPDFIASFHANAHNTEVSGSETLYYYKSSKGEQLAKLMQEKVSMALELSNRGIKPKSAEDRGGYLLCYTNAPCVICESFFIDHNADLERANELTDALAEAYADGIIEYAKTLS